jgi:hypothetical protein
VTPAELHAWVVAQWQAKLDVARAATPGPWEDAAEGKHRVVEALGSGHTVAEIFPCLEHLGCMVGDSAHIAAFDPAFAIAVCEAALRRLERHRPNQDPQLPVCRWCTEDADTDVPWPCPEVLDDASPFAGQPDFPEELKRS